MLKGALLSAIPLLMLAKTAVAVGCATHSFTQCADGITHWFDPDTGEICDPLDCGGGRAPPKTNVPGCPAYTGTELRNTLPSFLPCFTAKGAASTTAPTAPATTFAPTAPSANTIVVEPSTAPSSAAAPGQTAPQSSEGPTTAPTVTQSTAAQSTSLSSITVSTRNGTAGSRTSSSTRTTATQTANAATFVGGSLLGIAGAALGAIVLL